MVPRSSVRHRRRGALVVAGTAALADPTAALVASSKTTFSATVRSTPSSLCHYLRESHAVTPGFVNSFCVTDLGQAERYTAETARVMEGYSVTHGWGTRALIFKRGPPARWSRQGPRSRSR